MVITYYLTISKALSYKYRPMAILAEGREKVWPT